jgi:hypothetical protein
VGTPGLCVGVQFKAYFVNPRIRFGAYANFSYVSRYIRLELRAVTLKIKIVVRYGWWSWYRTVYSRRWGSYMRYLLNV